MKYIVTTVVMLMAIATTANAAPYGMAGCGLGAVVFKDEPGKIQIVAATLNHLVSPQTSAITSGTSNCYEEGSSMATHMYLENNYQALEKEVAQGEGETLAGLMTLLKCDKNQTIQAHLKNRYEYIYQDKKMENVKARLGEAISETKSCQQSI
jgi:hypothetical protein